VVKIKERKPPQALFDAFWREGELAMLFGEPGSGKSLLAVQIADAITRGTTLLYPQLPVKRGQKVLYVDLVLSEKQFAARYSDHKFEGGLFRCAPLDGEDLFEWTAAMIARHRFKVVVIDDLSFVARTDDGTRETLALMYDLRQMTRETGVSILVLADSYPLVFGSNAPERGLRRSRVLCGVSDSVFAIYNGKVIQTRTRTDELVWNQRNLLGCRIANLESGLLGMEFELPEIDDHVREQIFDIKHFHDDEKMTFRAIEDKLGISKSQAERLYKQWTPELEETVSEKRKQKAERDAHNADLDAWRESGGLIK